MSNKIKEAALEILQEGTRLPITLGALAISEVTPTFPGEIQTQQVIFTLEDDHEIEDECDDYAENVYYIDDPDLPDLPIHPNCKCYYRDSETDEEVDILITVGAAAVMEEPGEHWITTDSGAHILIKPGETVAHAIANHFASKSKIPTHNVSFDKAKQDFEKQAGHNKDFSYDPKTGKSYDAYNRTASKALYSRFSDGKSDLYFIGVTNHQGGLTHESQSEYEDLQNHGRYAMLGQWQGKVNYNDVSFPVNHGISEKEAISLKNHYAQEGILKISKDGKVLIL